MKRTTKPTQQKQNTPAKQSNEKNQLTLTQTKKQFYELVITKQDEILNQAASFINISARERMMKKNVDYILKADFKNAWNTEEGVDSIKEALKESLFYGATVPETGSFVPFGSEHTIVEFIPSVHCFKSALTTGENAPYTDIAIECIYENDRYSATGKDGQFSYEIKQSLPRGQVIGVVVAITKKDGSCIGELYDLERLMQKAEKHSRSYQYYLQDMKDLQKAKAAGKDHITKWNKPIYESQINNPYDGPDLPEMLKKLAGKSFLYPIFKDKMINSVHEENETENKKRKSLQSGLNETVNLLQQDIQNADYEEYEEEENEQKQIEQKTIDNDTLPMFD